MTNNLRKDASIGEFDVRTGITHITLQRGRLLFTMGPPSTKRAAAAAAPRRQHGDDTTLDENGRQACDRTVEPPAHLPRRRVTQRVFRSGVFTGRSLFAEEAIYLRERGALIVYEMEELTNPNNSDRDGGDGNEEAASAREPLTLAQLIALVTSRNHISMTSVDVYAFLKDSKLHPRRHMALSTITPTSQYTTDQVTNNVESTRNGSSGLFSFDVFKSITETQYITEEVVGTAKADATDGDLGVLQSVALPGDPSTTLEPSFKVKKRKVKRLQLVFRVFVCSFTVPSPKQLRTLIDGCVALPGHDGDPSVPVPVKLAVANADHSVLLYEVA